MQSKEDKYIESLWNPEYSGTHHYPDNDIYRIFQQRLGIYPTFLNDQQRKVYNFIHGTHY